MYDYDSMIQYTNDEGSNYINIEMIVKIPRVQSVVYVPQLAQVLKVGWVQYFYALVFWYFLLYRGLLRFLVTSNVFESIDVNDLNVKHIRPEK